MMPKKKVTVDGDGDNYLKVRQTVTMATEKMELLFNISESDDGNNYSDDVGRGTLYTN